jgi:Tfp pilus assembly protein PilN
MQAVNLLPEYARTSNRKFTAVGSELPAQRILYLGGLTAIAAALLVGVFYFHERSVVKDDKTQLADAQARLVAQDARAQPIKDAQAAVSARLAVVQSVDATRVHWDTVLGDLGRDLPTGVYLTSLNVSGSNTPAAGAVAATTSTGSSSFTIVGGTSSHVRVALILDRLALLPWLSNVSLGSSTRSSSSSGSSGSGAGVTFTITGSYSGGGS